MSAAPAEALPLAAPSAACLAASSMGTRPPPRSELAPIKAQVAAYLDEHGWANLVRQPQRQLCRRRWLYYRGDDNYGLGNVLYDVASAAALAMSLNRTLVYGADAADRKFGALINWPGVPTLAEVDGLRTRCGATLARSRRVAFTPDKCTFHRTWRREKEHLRCLRRLVGVNWLEERAPLVELSKVHAFTGVQVLLKSVHRPLRQRVAQLVGGCLPPGATRSNLFGVLLGALMRPVPAVLDAVRWTLQGTSRRPHPPAIALHARSMTDKTRAKNLTFYERKDQVETGLRCYAGAAARADAAARRDARRGAGGRTRLRIVLVSSSPELRDELAQQIIADADDGSRLEVVTFDWRKYLAAAPAAVAAPLRLSEEAADAFCGKVNVNDSFRCNRSAHLRDWGPDPHWAALVELLLASTATRSVLGVGFPYFKVCNTFTQIAAALADAPPPWLCPLAAGEGAVCEGGVELQCASRYFSTDWGSSAWRMFPKDAVLSHRGAGANDEILDCGRGHCMPTPLHPELWADLADGAKCAGGDTLAEPPTLFGQPIGPVHRDNHHPGRAFIPPPPPPHPPPPAARRFGRPPRLFRRSRYPSAAAARAPPASSVHPGRPSP